MKHQVETFVAERRQIRHIAQDGFQHEGIPFRDESILGKLLLRIVETSHIGSRRRKNGCLLPAAGREAQYCLAFNAAKPLRRNTFIWSENDAPSSLSSRMNFV